MYPVQFYEGSVVEQVEKERQPSNPGSPGKLAFKMEVVVTVYVCFVWCVD